MMTHSDWVFRIETSGEYIEQYGVNTEGLWIRTTREKANALIVQDYTQEEVQTLCRSVLSENTSLGRVVAEPLV